VGPVEAIDRGFVDFDGARLYYEVAGSGQPLVLGHAGIADLRMWDVQLARFAERYRTVRWDMRGFGRSPMPEGGGPYSNRNDLYGLLQALEIESGFLVGCSQGAETIIDFTIEHPEMVDALVLVGSAVSGFEFEGPEPPQWQELVAAFRSGDLSRAAELEVEIWVVGHGRSPEQVDPDILSRVRKMDELALSTVAARRDLAGPLEPPALGRLSGIEAPTLIVVGDADDPEILRGSDLLAKEIRGSKKIVMPETAHLPSMERPAEFNQHVLEFLAELS